MNWDPGIPNCLLEIILLDILLFYVLFIQLVVNWLLSNLINIVLPILHSKLFNYL